MNKMITYDILCIAMDLVVCIYICICICICLYLYAVFLVNKDLYNSTQGRITAVYGSSFNRIRQVVHPI